MPLMFLLTSLLGSAEAAGTIDVESAMRLAAERANDATLADLDVARQEIALRAARLAWTPDISAGAGVTGSLGRTFSEQLGANVTAPIVSLSGSLSASMPLYQGGALIAERRAAEAALDAARASRDQVVFELQWTAIDVLLQVGQAEAALEVQQAALEADQALLDQVSLQVEAGSRTPADRYAQQAVVAARQSSVARARQDLEQAQFALLSLLRLDPAAEAWSFVPPEAAPEVGGDAARLVDTAFVERPDLVAANAVIEASEQQHRAAAAEFLPSVGLGTGVSTSWLSTREDPLADQLEDQSRAWLSVDLSIPLLDRGVRRSRVDAAEVDLQQARLDRQRLEDSVALEIRQLLSAEAAAEVAVTASSAAVEAARQAIRVLQLRYESGAETLVSVTAARTSQVSAELEQARADAALRRIRYQLAYTTGRLQG